MELSSQHQGVMPSRAAEHLCRTLPVLMNASSESSRLSPTAYQQILIYCGVRPDIIGWRRFLSVFLALLGLLALVAGAIFFIAWNWVAMPRMAKFALIELLILALALVVWWRWYDALSQMALLAVGLSFGGLFALYGQVYQTGADSWELFRAWAFVLLPLALIGRQNGLWLCTWVIANLAFQLYHSSQTTSLFDSWMTDFTLPGYLAVQGLCLIVREALAEYASKKEPTSWLASRWLPRVMMGYLLLTITPLINQAIWNWQGSYTAIMVLILWGATLLAGYFYYRYRRPDLCMLTLGVISLMVVGCVLLTQMFDSRWDIGTLFALGLLMALWLVAGGALLLHWRRELYHRQEVDVAQNEVASLLQELRQQQLLNDDQLAEVGQIDHSHHLPWYLRAALAVGGWFAAIIILFLLALLLFVTDMLDSLSGGGLIICSLIIAIPAVALLRAPGIGKHQIGLAWAIAATFGLCFGVSLLLDDLGWNNNLMFSLLGCLPILAVMAWVMPDAMYRFMAVVAFIVTLILPLSVLASTHLPQEIAIGIIALLIAGVVAIWLWVIARQNIWQAARNQQTAAIAPLLYGIPAGMMLLCFSSINYSFVDDLFWHSFFHASLPLMVGIGIAAGLISAALLQVFRFPSSASAVYLSAALFCGAIAIFSPGIGFGLALLLAARYQGSKGLLVVTGCFFMLYLIGWYYFLGVTLLQKSLLLLVSGLLLLGLALAAKKLLQVKTGESHAN
ncbi:DUF4401 domain-containing protein [Serratia sp. DD3]|uniref:DUF4401 domain-containing protein n=1 Tax=Serratia sp. DD3 TaxID=1410619 RepID=UPI0003C4F917|nr:DUF4401 domain-containing protein [Serratia sp. DD3]KEY57680.1 putative membrane protein [Serratia sp. DD3]